MKAEDLKGRPIVSIAEGIRLGSVEDILFHPTARCIETLSLHGQTDRLRLYFKDIQSVGPDAITVRSQNDVKPIGDTKDPAIASLLTMSELASRKVVDESGTALGGIDSVEIDPATGSILDITAGHGGIAGLGRTSTTIDAAHIVSIGDLVVVKTPVAE